MITNRHFRDLDAVVVEHPKYYDTLDQCLAYSQAKLDGEVLLPIAPTGAGKSTLMSDVIEQWDEKAENDSSAKPVAVEAPAPKKNGFSWKDFYTDTLDALGEIGSHARISLCRESDGQQRPTRTVARKTATTEELSRAVNSTLMDRQTPALLIDEAQHIGASPQGRVTAANLDVVKWHSNSVDTAIVLMGTYQAQAMLQYTGQMSRRVRVLHFPPYYPNECDRTLFIEAAHVLIDAIDLPVRFSLWKNANDLHAYSVGCVGVFVGWLRRAMALAQRNRKSALELEDLWKSRHTQWELETMVSEIEAFDDFNGRRSKVGWAPKSDEQDREGNSASNGRRRPGTPKPRRWPRE